MQWLNNKGFIWFLFSNFSLTSFIFTLIPVYTGKQGTIYGTLVATYFDFCLHLITAQHSYIYTGSSHCSWIISFYNKKENKPYQNKQFSEPNWTERCVTPGRYM